MPVPSPDPVCFPDTGRFSGGRPLLSEIARAKVNLTLHVAAPRSDGYHPLESLVAFAHYGDELSASPAREFSLTISGPFAKELASFDVDDNLILKAARASGHPAMQFSLIKNLPVASGIGGGSADAAAALRLMQRHYGPVDNVNALALSLGADVPVCVAQEAVLMSGIGESLRPLSDYFKPDALPAILVNPGVAVSTGAIFKAYDLQILKSGAPDISHAFMESLEGEADDNIVEAARAGRNDLQETACQIAPVIGTVLSEMSRQSGARFTRMSGSGASCFAIFDTYESAMSAAENIRLEHPDWWCVSTWLDGQLK